MMRSANGALCTLFALTCFFSRGAAAQEVEVVQCAQCEASTRQLLAENTAISKWAPGNPVSVDVFVIDPSSTEVSRYGVEVQDDFREPMYWDRGGVIVMSWETAVPQEVLDYRYITASGGLNVVLPNDPQFPVNVYEDIENPLHAERISNYINTSTDGMWVIRISNWVAGYFGFDSDKLGKIIFTVHYKEGHTRRYEWDSDYHRFKPVPDTAKDNNGNRVPEEQGDVAPPAGVINYDFNILHPFDIQEFFNRLNMMGVPIYNTAGTRIHQPPSGGANVTCEGTLLENGHLEVRCYYAEVRIGG